MDERKTLDLYPLPIARGYRRFLNAEEPRERHDAAYYLFEVYLKYLSAVAVAHYLAGEERDHRVNAALKGLARPSLGEWLRFLRECSRFLASGKDADPALQAMAELLDRREARWAAVVRLENALRSLFSGRPSEKEAVSLEMLLGDLVAYRNQVLGHGAPRGAEHYARFGDLFGAAFPELLKESPFLTARRLVTFHSLRVREGSRVECGVVEHMGLAPLKRPQPLALRYGDAPPREAALHLLGDEGKLITLDPLLVAHGEDVLILNEAEGSPEYLSYATGERFRPSGIGGAQKDLFERILGYRVDESRVSRMGDDVAPTPASPGAAPPAAGERRLGDYRIVRELGRGAMGIVFEAVQESLGRRVALKVLPGSFALDPRRLERFRREARATARIHHPSIVPVYEVGEAEGNHFYAMELIAGSSLDRLLAAVRETGGPDRTKDARKPGSSSTSNPAYIASAVERMAELCEGLEGAHTLGLIHRDVKPSNVLVDADGRYVLVDFGLVHETEAQALTRSGEMVGTLATCLPSRSRGARSTRGRMSTRWA
jgi:tRNA A-37 threonylcarbamoyl transferase component Bud32